MFILIGESRIKLSSIGEYRKGGQTSTLKQWYLEIKVSNKPRLIYFDTEKKLDAILKYLDKALKVLDI